MNYSDWVHIYYSLQLIYFMPLRFITYHKKGYHYFLADLVSGDQHLDKGVRYLTDI